MKLIIYTIIAAIVAFLIGALFSISQSEGKTVEKTAVKEMCTRLERLYDTFKIVRRRNAQKLDYQDYERSTDEWIESGLLTTQNQCVLMLDQLGK